MSLIKKIMSATLVIFLTLSHNAVGQTMMAKMKYEEAEKAFQETDYKNTLKLVDEVEKMIKGTSPKTLYLKILATQKMGITEYRTLISLREYCGFFLEKYDNVEGIEDRYRDIYEISKVLNTYPTDEVGFNRMVQRNQRVQKQEEEKRATEIRTLEVGKKIRQYPFGDYSLELGMKRSDIPSGVWSIVGDAFLGSSGLTRRTTWYFRKSGAKIKQREGFSFLQLNDNNQLEGMGKNLMVGGKSDINRIFERYKEIAADFTKRFGPENVKLTDTTYTIEKVKYTYSTISLKKYAPSQIVISYSATEMGGILGTQVILSESHRVMGLYQEDQK